MTERPTWVEYLLAVAVFVGLLYLSFVMAAFSTWSQEPVGAARVNDVLGGLAVSLVLGVGAIGGGRALAGMRPLSLWLLLALPLPLVFLLDAAFGTL